MTITDLLSMATTFVTLGLIVASVMKMFQMANDMHEIKEVLKDMRRTSQGLGSAVAAPPMQSAPVLALNRSLGMAMSPAAAPSPVAAETQAPPPNSYPGTAPTPEELVRAVHAQHFGDDDFPL